jgi:soluble lytic murein transglycosylase-like protein
MAQRLGALLLLGVALAATSGFVHNAGADPRRPILTAHLRAARPFAPPTCPIPHRYLHAFKYAAAENHIPLPMLYAVARVESNLDPEARSGAGARGLLQVLPSTGTALALDINDPDVNVVAGARYLRAMLNRFQDTNLALAAYNAGPTAVAAVGEPPNATSVAYVANVIRVWRRDLRAVTTAC